MKQELRKARIEEMFRSSYEGIFMEVYELLKDMLEPRMHRGDRKAFTILAAAWRVYRGHGSEEDFSTLHDGISRWLAGVTSTKVPQEVRQILREYRWDVDFVIEGPQVRIAKAPGIDQLRARREYKRIDEDVFTKVICLPGMRFANEEEE